MLRFAPPLKSILAFLVTAIASYLSLATTPCGGDVTRSVAQDLDFPADQEAITLRLRALGESVRFFCDSPLDVRHYPIDLDEWEDGGSNNSPIMLGGSLNDNVAGAPSGTPAPPSPRTPISGDPIGECRQTENDEIICIFPANQQTPSLENELDILLTLYRRDLESSQKITVKAHVTGSHNTCTEETDDLGVRLEEVEP